MKAFKEWTIFQDKAILIHIFTNNEDSTKYTMCNFLKLKKLNFRRSTYKNK